MLNDSNSLYFEFRKIAYRTLLLEFSRQVDAIADQHSTNQITWDEALTRIEALILEFKLNVKQLGVMEDGRV